jgi:hypothetical protein
MCRELSRRLSEEMPLGYKKKRAEAGRYTHEAHNDQLAGWVDSIANLAVRNGKADGKKTLFTV